MKLLKILAVATTASIMIISLFTPGTIAKQEYTKKEKKACTFCHTSKSPKEYSDKDLNDAGKYYKEKKTLEGYKPSK